MMNHESRSSYLPDITTKFPNDADTDFKPEVIASSLIEQGYDPEQITIIRDGAFRRGFSKEVEEVEVKYSMHELQDKLHIRTNQEGIYDMLPQGLFHQPVYKKKFIKDREDALEEIRIHREEEFFTRKFFHLFEYMADKTLVEAYLYEARYDRKISNPEFVELFVNYWPFMRLLEHRQAVFFIHIVPMLHKIRTHHEKAANALSYILDAPVKITQVKLPVKKAERYYESHIGEDRLGVDLVQGNTFDDGEFDMQVIVGPISSRRMLDFIEPAKGYQLLEELCELFIPADKFVVKDFKILPEDSGFILSDENHTTYMGINSFI